MGYTLGLPPGLYTSDNEEIQDIVDRIKPLNGVILPSMIPNLQMGVAKQTRKKVLVTNLPLNISSEEIKAILISHLLKKKMIVDEEAVGECHINAKRFNATVTMRSQREAEAAVQLGSFVYGQQVMKIIWADHPSPSSDYRSFESFESTDTSDYLFIDSVLPLPESGRIANAFEECGFTVKEIEQSNEYNYCLVVLDENVTVEHAISKLNGVNVDGVKLRIRRIGNPSEAQRISQLELNKIRTSIGPSNMYSVLVPIMRSSPCIADILNCDVNVSIPIRPETERTQPSTGNTLYIYNIAPMVSLFDAEMCQDIISDIREECSRFGEVVSCEITRQTQEPLPSDYAIVKVDFAKPTDAKEAQMGISGRRYSGRIVITQLV